MDRRPISEKVRTLGKIKIRKMIEIDHSRRRFFSQMGSLTVGFSLSTLNASFSSSAFSADELPGSLRRYPQIDSWLQVLADNRIRVFTGKMELGQGIGIVIRQVAAEELNCDLDQVEVKHADTGETPNEGYTAGSGSVKASAMAVRYAAAAANQKIREIAAQKHAIAVEKLILKEGKIFNENGHMIDSISQLLAGKRWVTEVTLPVSLKPKNEYRYVGKALKGNQLKPSITGQTYFINDMKFPGMLHARVIKPPTYIAKLKGFDPNALKRILPDDVELIVNGNLVAVVGTQEYRVMKSANLLKGKLEWEFEQLPASQDDLRSFMEKSGHTESVISSPEWNESGLNIASGTFFKPYIMHGSMAPACGIAHFESGKLTVWTHSQGVFPFKAALVSMTGLAENDIRVIGVPGAGCFGHNSSDDAAAEAVVIALQKPGVHIRIQWSRDEEHRWEALGSAMQMKIRAGVTAAGKISFWQSEVWTDSHSVRPNSDAGTLLPARYIEPPFSLQDRGYLGGGYRNAEPYYEIPAKKIDAHFFNGPLRVSSLRSLGAYANVFAIESIIEELAHKLSQHPVDFRINNLTDERAVAVLQKLKEMTKEVSLKPGEGLGYAFSRYKNNDGYCAVAVYLKANDIRDIQLIDMWAVLDAGEVMNHSGLIKQAEGGMLQAASWTLLEEVKFNDQQIISSDWVRYPILRMRDTPNLHIELIDRPTEPALGGGEMAVPPTPAAITNAVYQATGVRIYDLPIMGRK